MSNSCDRVPTLLLTKNSRTFQDPKTFFQDSVVARQCFNIQTNSSYLLYTYSVSVQSIAKHSSQVAKKLFVQHVAGVPRTIHGVLYIKACWLIRTTSRFQDFPAP